MLLQVIGLVAPESQPFVNRQLKPLAVAWVLGASDDGALFSDLFGLPHSSGLPSRMALARCLTPLSGSRRAIAWMVSIAPSGQVSCGHWSSAQGHVPRPRDAVIEANGDCRPSEAGEVLHLWRITRSSYLS